MDEKVEQILLEMRENEHISEAFEGYGKKKNLEIWDIIDCEMEPIIKRQLNPENKEYPSISNAYIKTLLKDKFILHLRNRGYSNTDRFRESSLISIINNYTGDWEDFINNIVV